MKIYTIGKLKRQKEDVRKEILKAGFQVAQLGYDEKMKALAIAEDGITSFSGDVSSDNKPSINIPKVGKNIRHRRQVMFS